MLQPEPLDHRDFLHPGISRLPFDFDTFESDILVSLAFRRCWVQDTRACCTHSRWTRCTPRLPTSWSFALHCDAKPDEKLGIENGVMLDVRRAERAAPCDIEGCRLVVFF